MQSASQVWRYVLAAYANVFNCMQMSSSVCKNIQKSRVECGQSVNEEQTECKETNEWIKLLKIFLLCLKTTEVKIKQNKQSKLSDKCKKLKNEKIFQNKCKKTE